MKKNDRFKILPDGSADVTVNMPYAELCDLPHQTTEFTSEFIGHNPDLSPSAISGFSAILRAVKNLFPDEMQQRSIHEQMKRHERK